MEILNFEAGDKVKLIIGDMIFDRYVMEVDGYAVYLEGGGDAFDSRTGMPWGSQKTHKRICHA